MTNRQPRDTVSRRAALAGVGAGGAGFALAAAGRVAAQDATPAATAGHPVVGTWMGDLVPDDTTDPPTVIIFLADGAGIDPVRGTGGAWQPTGPRSAGWTLTGVADQESGTAIVVRATAEVDEAGGTYVGSSTITLVAPDGTVVGSFPNVPHGFRLPIEPVEAGGTALAGFPTWTPAPPATPTP